jgi:hypothetical protein
LRQEYSTRLLNLMLAVSLWLAAPALWAQSTPPPAPPPASQDDNPFPGEAPKAPAPDKPAAGQSTGQSTGQKPGQDGKPKPDSTAPQPKSSGDNPFPGEDTNAPIIPVDPGPGTGSSTRSDSGADSGGSPKRDADPDGDPVRSPDSPGNTVNDDGFSSSRSGLKQIPAEDDNDGAPGKSAKNKTREQVIKEDLDVGSYYLSRKNWKAAEGRFTSAFSLDSENPDAVWGLAETERHMQLYKEAAEHYKLFLSYDPDGPHSRAARKALEEVEAARPSSSASSKIQDPKSNHPE